ncbi:MAG TPA: bifunctional 5,10-methylenetetrahydrofolate dehydrogenase/5,10-methenyltetrahydrofolate cyclohydrolase [Alphaproteobacteria bacterium]|nr:bifunctional 5,10-methylenetetrahydrofolate dehydrogenase/5,10-methenyltetrahydrofolate cyclohydrolase [Alphaproteobacteria bacterium]
MLHKSSEIINSTGKSLNPIILDGKKLAEKVINEVGNEIKSKNIRLKLAIVLAGENSVSESYIKSKAKKCESIGVDFEILRLEADEEKIVSKIAELNDDESINGIIVQLPLPKNVDYDRVINSVIPIKDVDSLTNYNIQEMELGNEKLVPCTPKGILKILESYNIDMKGKNVVLVGNGKLVGKPLSVMLKNRGINPVVCNSKTTNLKEECLKADILISAAGIPNIITSGMVKEGAVVIDAGTSESSGKIVGDVDFEQASKKASYITPVPGGVGPMTVAMLIDNLLVARNLQNELINEITNQRDKK